MTLATPRTWVVGEVVTAAYMNAEIRDQWNDVIAPWVAYTPVWGSSGTAPALGNGGIVGWHKDVGKTCTALFEVTFGTTTTFGTGTYTWTVPHTAKNPSGSTTTLNYLGHARGHGAQWYEGVVGVARGTSLARIYSHNATTEWSPTEPVTWTASSTRYISGEVTYEIA
ncbi:hypothetical protein ACFU51_05025 [Streptomyces sp. NPDC057430]|uniref:hypothetical protein n=1 Tax=Streptomyces sp. NPDC057430 TaxID=3346131 RepID=UPI00369C8665